MSELETCTRACGYPHGGSVWQHGVTCWASRAINAENALAAAQATIAQRDDRLRVAQSEMRAHAGRADQLYADLMRSGKKVSALTDELIAATDRGNAWQTVAADLTERLCQESERLAARDAQVAELTAALDVVYRCARDRGNEMGGDRPTYELAFEAACIGAGALKFIEAHAQELLARTPAAPEGEAVAEEKSGTKEDRS